MNASYQEMAGRLMVALDFPDAGRAMELVRRLEGIPCYMKVGMQLFYAAGPDFVRELKAAGYSVFLDVKMHDIPNTVKGGSHSVTRLGVDMFNVPRRRRAGDDAGGNSRGGSRSGGHPGSCHAYGYRGHAINEHEPPGYERRDRYRRFGGGYRRPIRIACPPSRTSRRCGFFA